MTLRIAGFALVVLALGNCEMLQHRGKINRPLAEAARKESAFPGGVTLSLQSTQPRARNLQLCINGVVLGYELEWWDASPQQAGTQFAYVYVDGREFAIVVSLDGHASPELEVAVPDGCTQWFVCIDLDEDGVPAVSYSDREPKGGRRL